MNNLTLIKKLTADGTLKTERISDAFREIDRAHFVKQEYDQRAHDDTALPIHSGQTISQPTTVAFMLELLQPMPGDRVLDVGSGSGWSTALLANIVGYSGFVWGVEIMIDLLDFGRKNLLKEQITNAQIVPATNILGYPDKAPYDKILVSAFSTEVPDDLVEQLKVGGRMVLPVNNSVIKIEKVSETEINQEEYPGFVFVPLILPDKNLGIDTDANN